VQEISVQSMKVAVLVELMMASIWSLASYPVQTEITGRFALSFLLHHRERFAYPVTPFLTHFPVGPLARLHWLEAIPHCV
jgi:hypothetical protein